MSLKYVELKKHPLKMDREEIREHLDFVPWAIVMRSLLMFEIERVRQSETPEPRTLRFLWYSLIKPALEKLGALQEEFYDETRVKNKDRQFEIPKWDQKLSMYLSELVDQGITTYEQLGIVDGSRPRRSPCGQHIPVHTVSTVRPYPNIILFTEKDTVFQVVEDIAAVFGIAALSGSGEPSHAATEHLVRSMVKNPNFGTSNKIWIFSLTDYDPSGYDIAKNLMEQVRKVASSFDILDVYHQRLGLIPEQLSPEEREENKYSPKGKGLANWMIDTGGIDGEAYGLELDALPISRIRELFIEGIQSVMASEEPYYRDLKKALVDLLIFESLKGEIERRKREIYEAIDGDRLIEKLEKPVYSVAEFAQAGYRSINPLEEDADMFQIADTIRARIQNV